MTSGWGVDATLNGSGVPISGTTDTDIRKISGALYTPGIISGCTVTTSASVMSYTVSSGVVAIQTATGEIVLAPVSGTTVVTPAAPSTGSRVDIVWARQKFPDTDSDSSVVIEVGTTLPPKALALKRYTVSAGNTNTNAAIQYGGIDFATTYGSSLGILFQHRNTDNSWFTNASTFGNGTIYVPTDRLLKISLLTCASSAGAVGFDNSKYCEAGFDVYVDQTKKWKWNSSGLTEAWATFYWEDYMPVYAGSHTVSYTRYRSGGSGNPWHHYAANDAPGSLFTVEDIGPMI